MVKTASTLQEARVAFQEEMPLVVYCDLDMPDGSGIDFLDEVRTADKEVPFILASCHDKEAYVQEAMRRGATLCMDKMKGQLLQDKLVEYACLQALIRRTGSDFSQATLCPCGRYQCWSAEGGFVK